MKNEMGRSSVHHFLNVFLNFVPFIIGEGFEEIDLNSLFGTPDRYAWNGVDNLWFFIRTHSIYPNYLYVTALNISLAHKFKIFYVSLLFPFLFLQYEAQEIQ